LRHDAKGSFSQVAPPRDGRAVWLPNILLAVGLLIMVLPTMFVVAKVSWSSEQGGHGPIVLVTGIWLLWRELVAGKPFAQRGKLVTGLIFLAPLLAIFIAARITGVLEIEAMAMYGALVVGAYLLFGAAVLRTIWFPLVYLAFMLPPPDTAVAAITQPIKISISEWAVTLLHTAGYPVASSGVTIQIGQYQLLVAAACAGLNSIVTLGALCLFYVYLRHRSNFTAFVVVALAAVPVAMFSNFIRVVTLVLVTYYLGDAAGQGFVHDFAGLLMFAVALLTIFAVDRVATPFYTRRGAASLA
jgi:exosortase